MVSFFDNRLQRSCRYGVGIMNSKRLGRIAERAVVMGLCSSMAFSFTSCGKKSYKGEVDKFIDVVGSTLGGDDYVFESMEDASEAFYGTRDLEEFRPLKEWTKKDYLGDYFHEADGPDGFFYRGDYSKLWDSLEESFRDGETFYEYQEKRSQLRDKGHYSMNPKNPTNENLISMLEYSNYGMVTRSIELMRLYETEEAAYFTSSSLGSVSTCRYMGMRVIFKSKSDAKDYWAKLIDVDDSFIYDTPISRVDDNGKVEDRYQECLDAFHDMDEENYWYYDKRNEGYMTFHVGTYFSGGTNEVTTRFVKLLFSIEVRDREVTMFFSFLIGDDYDLEEIGKLYDNLELNNPLDTELLGIDKDSTREERNKHIIEKHPLEDFFNSYYTSARGGIMMGVGVAAKFNYMNLPLVVRVENAAWIPYVYDDLTDYIKELNGDS